MLKFKWSNPFNIRQSESEKIRERLFGNKRFSWKKFRFWSGRILIGLGVFILLLFAWYAKDLPTPGKIKNLQSGNSVQLFDRNNKPIYSLSGGIKRFDLEAKDIPEVIKQTTITAEDRYFYHNFAIDPKGLLRAVITDVFHGSSSLQGGSTITQQFVKNTLLSPERTLTRKIKELILAIEVEIMYSKEDILTMYLNQMPYGGNNYGIEAASRTFFDKHAQDLSLAEAATLAALLQRPSYFSPYGTHGDVRLTRVNWILDSMVDLKYIDQAQADVAKADAKDMTFAERKDFIVAPHFAQYVKDTLVDRFGEQMIEEGGLKVTTTLDLDKQTLAEDALRSAASGRFNGINASNGALVSLDPKTGQILAMVGSADYFNNEIDGQVNVAVAERQPGSAFKPIVYAAAFKDKYNPASPLWDVTTDFGNGYIPQNYDGATHGPVTMRTALANSLNIPAVKTLYLAGLDKALQTAHDMGITTLNDRDRYGLSLVLGGGEVKLIDLTTAYGVFANNGKLAATTPILKVVNSRGKTLVEYKDSAKEVLDPQIAYEISSILSDNNARSMVFGTNSALYISGRTVAAKTGTTSEYRDAWTVGYTPQVVTGVWVGNNDNTPMSAGAAGAMAAAPIWRQYMSGFLKDLPNEDFYKPSGIQTATVDKLSNKLPNENSPEADRVTDIFASWQIPKNFDDIHLTIKIDKKTGNRASANCPDSSTDTKTFTTLHSEVPSNPNWENPVLAAAEEFGINVKYPPTETSCTQGGDIGVKIKSPDDKDKVSSSFVVEATVKSKVKKVELAIDGKTIDSDSNTPYNFSVSGLKSGTHILTVTATDSDGLTDSDSISVTVK